MALIRIRGLSTIFGPRPKEALQQVRAGVDKAALLARGHTLALHDIDLDIRAGEIFVIMGLSGSGKSTLVRHINRLIDPTAGSVSIDGEDVLAMRPDELIALRRRRLAMVFQGFGLLAHLSVLDNVAFGLELRGVARAERQERARHWIERVALQGFEQHRPSQLSGGMRQRVGLARALCSDTDIILMDEAFSALDPLIRSQLQGELLTLQAELGRTVVFITHDLDEALRLGDRVAILRDGRLAQVGTPGEVLMAPADEQVAAFVRDVNRARALTIDAARVPWPADAPPPPPERAVDADLSIEQVLPMLVGRRTPLALRRGGTIVGQVSMDAVRDLLAQQD
ncbi:MAG: betaine/proline/choline family ABC transporter ATP-binding protein [Piscinibacter sp.]|nr:betaine/proline/choline family ABC transporter ATP-binding protein [Piscinibacter sp.]